MTDQVVRLMYLSWDEFDHAFGGLSAAEMTTRGHGGSAIAWTAGHVANTIDVLLNRRFAGAPPHMLLSNARFGTGGKGDAHDWKAIRDGVIAVRKTARAFLRSPGARDLGLTVPYDGSVAHLRESGLSLRYALMAIAAHHFLHTGEIVTLRSLMGRAVGDYPDWGRGLV